MAANVFLAVHPQKYEVTVDDPEAPTLWFARLSGLWSNGTLSKFETVVISGAMAAPMPADAAEQLYALAYAAANPV